MEVVTALPVLLVDGDISESARFRGSDFLRDALSPARDKTPSVQAKLVPLQDFTPASLLGEAGSEAAPSRPRVLVLCNVARLTAPQQEAIVQFLAEHHVERPFVKRRRQPAEPALARREDEKGRR